MTGNDLYNLLSNILGGENIDNTFALQLINIARLDLEQRRPWQVLKAKDTSQTSLSGQNITTPYSLPTPTTPSSATPYLMRFLLEGAIRLINTANVNQIISLREIPFENQLDYQGQQCFYVDYAARMFYILANIPGTYTIAQFFIADFGDITNSTTWIGFPSRFAPALAFQAAARYRLGTDYDDIAARNADQNFQTAEVVYKSMTLWDANISQQVANNRPFGAKFGGSDGGGYFPPPRGYNEYGVN